MPKGLFQTVEERMTVEGYSRRTIKTYLRELRKFVMYIRPRHPRDLDAESRSSQRACGMRCAVK